MQFLAESAPMRGTTGRWRPRSTSTPGSASSSSSTSEAVPRPREFPSRCASAKSLDAIRDGQAISMQLYASADEALEAVGLSE